MSGFEIETYRAEHRDAYLRLMSEAWEPGAMSGEVFDWWFLRNPAGSLMSVAVIEGAVVGVASHTLAHLRLRGQDRLAQYSVHAVTSERARGLGIFKALERRHEELGQERGSACVLAFASASTHALFLGPLGWSQIDRRRVWGRPLRGAIGRRLRRHSSRPSPRSRASDVRSLDRFDAEQEEAYGTVAPLLRNHVIRDRAYLQWRYVDTPKGYSAYASSDGFAVVGRGQRGRIATALLMELVAPPDRARPLLRHCIRETKGADVLLAVPSPTLPTSLLARCGFAPLHTRLDYMGKALALPLERASDSWAVSLGDTDFF